MTARVAAIGCGYWGKNLVRNFAELGVLSAVSDANAVVAAEIAARYGVAPRALDEILSDPAIDAVAIAAPAALHASIGEAALLAGKHVFVEKPLALTVTDAERLCDLADARRLTLMVGHLLQYHPAFLALKALVDEGALGRLQYLYSNRLNLGKIRREENILWSFAPHDISMILSLVGAEPESVWATGGRYLHDRIADVTTTHLAFASGQRAHVHVSWLHPFKEQKLVVIGDRAMAVLDDGEDWPGKLRLYRHQIDWRRGHPEPVRADAEAVPLEPSEPLREECAHFIDSVERKAVPRTDGREGVRVLKVLAKAEDVMTRSIGSVNGSASGVTVHPSAYVDEPSEIGEGTRIWHFSHVLRGSRIGRDCSIGQNVVIGPDVSIGDRCKIQNNVSVYEGVTLEQDVFCGPSCVFTNVVNPRAEVSRRDEFRPTVVRRGASIGANATIVCGHEIGAYAFIAAGAVVTSDVPPHALMAGVPARRIGWVSHDGQRLGPDLTCRATGRQYVERDGALVEREGTAVTPEIQFVDLQAQRHRLGAAMPAAIDRVLSHGRFIMGPEVDELEAELARFTGARHVLTCSSGTDALLLAVLALGVCPGDAVIIPAFTFPATPEVVSLVGATPVFADVEVDTFNLSANSVEVAARCARDAGLRPVGVIAVDLYGQPADYARISEVADHEGMWVVADAAQSLGGARLGRSVGTLASVTATSFFPAKPLGCYGDGGALFTDDAELAAVVRSLRSHGAGSSKYEIDRIGINGRLDTLQAAILLEKLKIFPDELGLRDAVAAEYSAGLTDVVVTPTVADATSSAWAQYTVQVANRDQVAQRLGEQGVPTAVYYPRPLHHQRAYHDAPRVDSLPNSEELASRVLSLPMHPYLDENQRSTVISTVRRCA